MTHALQTLTNLTSPTIHTTSDRISRQRLSTLPIPLDPTYRTPHTRSNTYTTQHHTTIPPLPTLPLPPTLPPPLDTTPLNTDPRPHKRRPLTLTTSTPSIFPYCHSQPPLDLHLTDLQRQGFWSSPSHSPQRAPPATLSLIDNHVTICTSPVNPDLDIHPTTGTFCIQIGLTYPSSTPATPPLLITAYPHGQAFAHAPSTTWHRTSAKFLYNPSGLFLACLPIDRLLWLHDSYLASRASNHHAFQLHSSGDFLTDLASLFHRYPLPKTNVRPTYPNEYWSPPVCFCPKVVAVRFSNPSIRLSYSDGAVAIENKFAPRSSILISKEKELSPFESKVADLSHFQMHEPGGAEEGG